MKGNSTNLVYRWSSGIFQMLVLLWLTVSTPFVTSFQQQIKSGESRLLQVSTPSCSEQEDEKTSCNPFANTTEEKTESGSITFSEEYLHEHHEPESFLSDQLKHAKCGHSRLYIAYHGELLSPPPEA